MVLLLEGLFGLPRLVAASATARTIVFACACGLVSRGARAAGFASGAMELKPLLRVTNHGNPAFIEIRLRGICAVSVANTK